MTPDHDFSPEERDLLKEAFLRLIPQSDEMAKSLYAHLFERLPEVRSLFQSSMEEQRDKLIRMLAYMIDSLDRPDELSNALHASGERHRGYGAKPEHYGPLGESLIEALKETCSPPPTPEEEALWVRLYERAAWQMNNGTQK